jgi:hypothetical protein
MDRTPRSHTFSSLRDKRARISGEIEALRKKIARLQVDREHVDKVLQLLNPGFKPETITPIRPRNKSQFPKLGQLGAMIVGTLRRAKCALTTQYLVDELLGKCRYSEDGRSDLSRRVRSNLDYLCRSGRVIKTGVGPDVLWEIAKFSNDN